MADQRKLSYHDVTEDRDEIQRNPDPALNPANQHVHPHNHHMFPVEDKTVYAKGTNLDSTIVPTQEHEHGAAKSPAAATPLGGNHQFHHDNGGDINTNSLPNYSDHDHEKGETGILADGTARSSGQSTSSRKAAARYGAAAPLYRARWHLLWFVIGGLFTGWWIASLILHRNDMNWVIPFLLWLAIMIRLITLYIPARHVSNAIKWSWQKTAIPVYDRIPVRMRTPLGAAVAIAVVLVGSFVSPESADNTRENRAVSLFGMLVIIGGFWATSKHRRAVNWRTVIVGMLAQYIIGLFVLRTGVGYDIFSFIAGLAGDLLGFAKDGVAFLTSDDVAALPYFFFGVVPAIIFFISLVQVLYYFGFIQWFIKKLATFVYWLLGASGAEAVVAAATPFIGQGESAMLVRPFVPHMTKAEIHQIMTCGFATISGSVLVGYIGLGLNAEALVSSCIMSIPASIAISKLRYPEVEETLTAGRVVIPDDDEHKAENFLHAFANGSWFGIKIGGTIVASLLCIIALVGLINGLLTWWGHYININDPELTLQTILGYILYPVAFLLGVPRDSDLLKVARLIAEKVITNEYVGFTALASDPYYADLSPRSQLIATYALCGFGNIGSLGIQIGILSQLAPSRGGDVSGLAFSALVSGVFATLTSASVAGLVITDQLSHFTKSGTS